MANPIAVPGTNVPIGAAVSPGGAQGVQGAGSTTTNTASFTVPPVGSTVVVTVADPSWMLLNEFVYVNNAGGAGLAGAMQITALTGNQVTLLNPTPAPAIPNADPTQAGLLKQLSGNTTDFIDGTNNSQNLVNAIQPTIWSARLRSFSSVGNPTFEADQANCGAAVTIVGGNRVVDRWFGFRAGTMAATGGQVSGNVVVPGTNFVISRSFCRITLTTQQASLGASDQLSFYQQIEGPQLRELIGDVHSLQLLVRSSVAGLKFSICLGSSGGSPNYSISYLATIPSANTWTLLQFPNLPVWTASVGWPLTPGVVGYVLYITLAAGVSLIPSSNSAWGTPLTNGAVGMSNFAASPVNSTLDIAYAGHEPGALCTTPIDCPFTRAYDDALRYFQKTYLYGVVPGAVNQTAGLRGFVAPSALTTAYGTVSFHKPMAKTPTVTLYNYATGASGSVQDGGGNNHSGAVAANVGDTGFSSIGFTTATVAATNVFAHYTADTGW
jgi:hypothetical protein